MDWSQELIASLKWLGQAFAISVVCLVIAAILISRFTKWGKLVARIAWPWFQPRRSFGPILALCAIVLMTLFSVRMNVLFSAWYNGFYTALQKLDSTSFWTLLGVFGVLATVHVLRALVNYYLQQAFLIHWRSFLTNMLLNSWTKHQGYYRARFVGEGIDNPDQRIQQDVTSFADSSLSLAMGLLNAVVSLFEFTIILWGLSGALAIFGYEVPRAMVFCVYAYVLVATGLAVWIGRPLIGLNFLNEKLNANFRYALVRLREYGESVAFFRGESVEQKVLTGRFAEVIENAWAMIRRSLKFQGFNLSISQAAAVFPFIVQAPRLFSQQIALGDVMQTSQAFGQVQDALSFVRESYDSFANYRAVVNRLSGFLDAMEAVERLPSIKVQPAEIGLQVKRLTVCDPTGKPLISELSFSAMPASNLLVRGPSGCGKTTLLRAIAGLWPFAEGEVLSPPAADTLFLPQKPYLPLGTLAEVVAFPNTPKNHTEISNALQKVRLEHLSQRLNEDSDWTATLSLGEQQRLAIARALLAKPRVLFMDEASSAMDEGLEYAMYKLLGEELPSTVLISVGHRSSLSAFHSQTLVLSDGGRWQIHP